MVINKNKRYYCSICNKFYNEKDIIIDVLGIGMTKEEEEKALKENSSGICWDCHMIEDE